MLEHDRVAQLVRRLEDLGRRLERARQAEERLRGIVEAAPDGILVADSRGRITFANSEVERMFGWSREELASRPIEVLVPARLRKRHLEHRGEFQAHPRSRPMGAGLDLRAVRKDGTEFPVEISLSPLPTAEGNLVVAVVRDVTERRRIEAEVRSLQASVERREVEERFRLLFENVTDLIMVLDADMRIRYASPSSVPILGREPSALVGVGVLDLTHPDDGGNVSRLLDAPRDHPGPAEFRVRHAGGSWCNVEATATDLRDNPAVAGVVLSLRDVTERRQLERVALQSQKIDSVGRLAGGVAHDFNNLLTGILSYTELALHAVGDGPARGHLEVVDQTARRAADLTQKLLAFSRRQVMEPRVVAANDLVAGIEKLLRGVIEENVMLVVRADPDAGRVRVDPGQIEQVLVNLAVNARDAMPGGGTLTIGTANVTIDETSAGAVPGVAPGEYVLISVGDTGSGMTDEVKAHLFEPFFTTKERGRGTGLGLATSYGIVRQSGGHIVAYSEVGHGTLMKVYLPRVHDAAEPREPPAMVGGAPRGGETVLVVEDDAALRSVTALILGQLGYTVLQASGGEEAIQVAAAHSGPVDLLLSDVVMPGMSGTELAARLREDHPGMRVLLMSGYASDSVVRQGLADRGAAFIPKPFSLGTLGRKVRAVLDSAGPER